MINHQLLCLINPVTISWAAMIAAMVLTSSPTCSRRSSKTRASWKCPCCSAKCLGRRVRTAASSVTQSWWWLSWWLVSSLWVVRVMLNSCRLGTAICPANAESYNWLVSDIKICRKTVDKLLIPYPGHIGDPSTSNSCWGNRLMVKSWGVGLAVAFWSPSLFISSAIPWWPDFSSARTV